MADPDELRRNFGALGGERFRDSEGQNRFTEPLSDTPIVDHPYAAPAAELKPSYAPGDYVATAPHRGGTVFWLGLIGLLCGLAGIPLALFCSPVISAPALCFSIPAWLMGRQDLQAIHAGAMDATGRTLTKVGYVAAIIGCLLATGEVFGWLFFIGWALLSW